MIDSSGKVGSEIEEEETRKWCTNTKFIVETRRMTHLKTIENIEKLLSYIQELFSSVEGGSDLGRSSIHPPYDTGWHLIEADALVRRGPFFSTTEQCWRVLR
jgi:hypothetical protein